MPAGRRDLYHRVIDATGLTPREKLCLCAFVSLSDPDKLTLEPPYRGALAAAMSVTDPTVGNAIADLKGRGIVEAVARWRHGEVLCLRPEAIPQGEPDGDIGNAILRRAAAFDRADAEKRLAAEAALARAATAA
jgi:DNA-binding transcriptional ArsR family regulator